MHIQSVKPPEDQRDYLRECYYFSIEGAGDSRQRPVIDDCCYDLIFYREGKAGLLYGPARDYLPIPHKVFTIHGLQPPYRFAFEGPLTFFTVKLQPWANGTFFNSLGAPGIYDLSEMFPGLLSWHDRLFERPVPAACLEAGAHIFEGYCPELTDMALWVKQLCWEIEEAGGMVSVSELSQRHGVSRQHLGKVFRAHVLYSLKHYILTVRMIELVKLRMKQPGISLTALAHQFEYFDQSHFNRDFRKFCGMTPKAFFAEPPEFMERH